MWRNTYKRNKSYHDDASGYTHEKNLVAQYSDNNYLDLNRSHLWSYLGKKDGWRDTSYLGQWDVGPYPASATHEGHRFVNVGSTRYSKTMTGLSINTKLNSLSRVMHKLATLTVMRHLLLWPKWHCYDTHPNKGVAPPSNGC